MGRGRAKAKQTKVARELKYSTHGTDLDALRAELASDRPNDRTADRTVPSAGPAAAAVGAADADDADADELDDPYSAYVGDEDDED
jgi:Protein of unknown function (DUF3073)